MRKIFIIVLSCVVVLLAGYAGYRGYKVWKNKHLVSLGHQFLAKQDQRNALLSLQEALRSDPRNVDAVRAMADMADAAHWPSAALWRSRVVELSPHSLTDRLALAQTALFTRDFATATNALDGADPADKETAAYHNIAGVVTAAAGRHAEAENHFLQASRLEPQNISPQLNLAIVRLQGTNTLETDESRALLQAFASNPSNSNLRCQALRELTADSLRRQHGDVALALSQRLVQETNCSFNDKLLRLETLLETKSVDFEKGLEVCQKEAAAEARTISELGVWEMSKVSPDSTLKWLRTLPPHVQTNQPATLLIAECYTASEAWGNLQSWLQKQHWGDTEFVRHAFLSQAMRGQGLNDSAKTEWEQALKSASAQKQSLVMLLRMAAQWDRVNDVDDLLWTMVERYPHDRWASRILAQSLFRDGQTRSLLRLFNQELKAAPADLTTKNNVAMLALLLNDKEFKPDSMALEVYEKSSTNASFASTYALSLYMQGKNAEALKVMEQIKPQDLERPPIAGYYGLILKATGSPAKAREYLDASGRSILLPEERKLFSQARMGT